MNPNDFPVPVALVITQAMINTSWDLIRVQNRPATSHCPLAVAAQAIWGASAWVGTQHIIGPATTPRSPSVNLAQLSDDAASWQEAFDYAVSRFSCPPPTTLIVMARVQP